MAISPSRRGGSTFIVLDIGLDGQRQRIQSLEPAIRASPI
jgi:hypothetical protein